MLLLGEAPPAADGPEAEAVDVARQQAQDEPDELRQEIRPGLRGFCFLSSSMA